LAPAFEKNPINVVLPLGIYLFLKSSKKTDKTMNALKYVNIIIFYEHIILDPCHKKGRYSINKGPPTNKQTKTKQPV
jgi:hypothetical protein